MVILIGKSNVKLVFADCFCAFRKDGAERAAYWQFSTSRQIHLDDHARCGRSQRNDRKGGCDAGVERIAQVQDATQRLKVVGSLSCAPQGVRRRWL